MGLLVDFVGDGVFVFEVGEYPADEDFVPEDCVAIEQFQLFVRDLDWFPEVVRGFDRVEGVVDEDVLAFDEA